MKDDVSEQHWAFKWGLPISAVLHVLIAALLIVGLPVSLPTPHEEQAITVDLVPPPEQEAEAEPPPPATEPPPPAPEPPPPAPEPPPKPEEQAEAVAPQPMNNIAPPMAFQFGEEDSGPRLSPEGDSAEDGSRTPAETAEETLEMAAEPEAPTQEPETAQQAAPAPETSEQAADDAKPENAQDAPAPVEQAALEQAEPDVAPPAPSAMPPIEPPQGEAAPIADAEPKQADEALAESDEPATKPALPETVAALPAARPPAPPPPKPPAEARNKPSSTDAEVREALKPRNLEDIVASLQTNGSVSATTDMRDLNRGERAGRLCYTQLRQRLLNATYDPDYLPYQNLKSGNVIDIQRAGFRFAGEWYDLSYRCAVDPGATRVVSFDVKIGGRVPRSEWGRRKFPTQ